MTLQESVSTLKEALASTSKSLVEVRQDNHVLKMQIDELQNDIQVCNSEEHGYDEEVNGLYKQVNILKKFIKDVL
jgi:peptidoglycan hydrolase CwlO-like protein